MAISAPWAPTEAGSPATDVRQHQPARRRPRILYFLRRVEDQLYGGTRSILLFLENQQLVDPFVVVGGLSPADPVVGELDRLGIPHRFVPLPAGARGHHTDRDASRPRRLRSVLQVNAEVTRLIRELQPDLIHVDWEAFRLVEFAARRTGLPVVLHVRGTPNAGRSGPKHWAAMGLASTTVFVSEQLRQLYLEGAPAWIRDRLGRKCVAVHNGIRLAAMQRYCDAVPREAARAALEITPDEVAIVLVGGIFWMKGQQEFFAQVAPRVNDELPNARFYVVGGVKDEKYMDGCMAAIRASGLQDRVIFAGYQNDVFRWFRAMDVLAVPSVREGFGRVVVEAQAFGVPVVANDIVGVREGLMDGQGGFLAQTPEDFAQALVRLGRDATLRADVGRKGRVFSRRFDVATVSRDLEGLYLRVLGGESA